MEAILVKRCIEDLTISSAVEAVELGEIRGLIPGMVVEQSSHHSWPGLREYQITFAFALDFIATFI